MVNNANNERIRLLMAMASDAENSIDAMFGLAPRRPMQIPRPIIHTSNTTVNDNHIRISDSTIGVLNTGTVGTLNASVTILEQTNPELAAEVTRLVEAVSSSTELAQEARKEVIEQVSYVLSQLSVPAEQRNTSVLKGILTAVATTLATSADLYTLWQALHPTLTAQFPM